MTSEPQVHSGSCLCGAVRYEVAGPLRPVIGCHCTQCRKTSGHYVAATSAPVANLRMVEDRGLKWYRSSDVARRGFCGECGSSLFWQPDGMDLISIMAGALDGPTGLSMDVHIFCSSHGDYYEIPSDARAFPGDFGS